MRACVCVGVSVHACVRARHIFVSLCLGNNTERYFKWDEDGADNYLAYKAAGRSEESDNFALVGPFFKDPADDTESAEIAELVQQTFSSALRHCDKPAFLQLCRDSLAVMLHHKVWLSQHCPYLNTQPFMNATHNHLSERVFVGFEEDAQCPTGRHTRGVPDHLWSRIQLQREVRCWMRRGVCLLVFVVM